MCSSISLFVIVANVKITYVFNTTRMWVCDDRWMCCVVLKTLLDMVEKKDITEEEVGQRILTALKQVRCYGVNLLFHGN